MPTIKVERAHALGFAEAKTRASALLDRYKEKMSHLVSEITWSDDGTKGKAKGRMFSAEFTVTENKIGVVIELSILAAPMKGQIESQVVADLEKRFS